MKLERARPNVFTLTVASQELSALIAAARLAVDAMRTDPEAPKDALQLLGRILDDYDRALARIRNEDGRSRRPSGDSPGTAA
jgi:hypothetical protein